MDLPMRDALESGRHDNGYFLKDEFSDDVPKSGSSSVGNIFPSETTQPKTVKGRASRNGEYPVAAVFREDVSSGTVLLICGNASARTRMRHILETERFHVLEAGWEEQAFALIDRETTVVLIDSLAKRGRTDLLCQSINERFPDLPIVVMNELPEEPEFRRTIYRYAFSCLAKSCDKSQLVSSLTRAVQNCRCSRENQGFRETVGHPILPIGMVGASPAIQILNKQIEVSGRLDNTVLIRGERGTGKNIIAQLIHQTSARANAPFLVFSCNSLSGATLEADLFGYIRGFLNVSQPERIGRLELLSRGTVFLDQIECLSLPQQAKLLLFLQERAFHPLGAFETRKADTRIIASSRGGLETACAQGRFREDLFSRLGTTTITAPALRDRLEDIPSLSQAIVARWAWLYGTNQPIVSSGAISKLKQHFWPGNIRELESVLQKAFETAKNSIIAEDDILLDSRSGEDGLGDVALGLAGLTMVEIERQAIIETIRACGGNRALSAQKLGISEKTIYNKIKLFKLRGIV